MAVAPAFNTPRLLSRANSGESTQSSCQPLQDISSLPLSMTSRISGYQHVIISYAE
jgi:hypothetical protein